MFRIGEFAQIAQVSTRQLRFYDQLGLLCAEHTDRQTGYRYYTIRQLQRLNMILALKDLGLTLEQIGNLLDQDVSPETLRGMLLLRKAETEQSIQEGELRLRHIESRIAQIDSQGDASGFDVVTKALPAQAILATHRNVADFDEAAQFVVAAAAALKVGLPRSGLGNLVVVASNDPESERMDVTVGKVAPRAREDALFAGGFTFAPQVLPAVPTAATLVRRGTNPESHAAFAAIGTWIEANRYSIAGPSREVFLEPVLEPPGFEMALVEIQFPLAFA